MSCEDQRIQIQSLYELFPFASLEHNLKGDLIVFQSYSCGLWYHRKRCSLFLLELMHQYFTTRRGGG